MGRRSKRLFNESARRASRRADAELCRSIDDFAAHRLALREACHQAKSTRTRSHLRLVINR